LRVRAEPRHEMMRVTLVALLLVAAALASACGSDVEDVASLTETGVTATPTPTFGRERTDLSEEIDEFVALASCLREAGVEIDDPTAETLIEWRGALRPLFADPAFPPIFERCNAAGQ
jgi:hypothetical protein